MDEQNYGGQPPQPGGWNPVGQGQQAPYSAPGYPPPAQNAPGYASGAGYPPPPPPPPGGGYGQGPGGYPPPPPPGQPPYGQPPYGQPPYGGPPVPPPPPGAGLPPNTAAALSYLTIIPAIIFLVMDPYKRSNFVRFHAWQCIVLTGVWVAFDIIQVVLLVLPLGPLWILRTFIHLAFVLVFLGLFIFWLIAIIKASKGERYHIPVVGGIAENFTGTV